MLLLLIPGANDQGFAMTGSYSCMTLLATLVFDSADDSQKKAGSAQGEFKQYTKADLKGMWSVFFFYPADFTFVCPTELAEKWLPETHSVVFTSATIAVGDDFSHFEHAVGLDRGAFEHKSLHLDSSFDYENHMAVFVAEDMPAPTDPGYLDALEKEK